MVIAGYEIMPLAIGDLKEIGLTYGEYLISRGDNINPPDGYQWCGPWKPFGVADGAIVVARRPFCKIPVEIIQ